MKIMVAGAGAGKTTSMAERVLERYESNTEGKIIYVITYTNAARDKIRNKIIDLKGTIPEKVLIETSHAFLLREFIFPFHHLLYGQQYTTASQINLPNDPIFRATKIKELRLDKIIHVEDVTKTAKWIICNKTKDTKEIKEKRGKILSIISRYLDSVFIDEAQDMDSNLAEILECLNNKGVNLNLVGDPKQDLRGRNEFRKLINKYSNEVDYKKENHRCPISHVSLANLYIPKEQQQKSQISKNGKLNYIFESDIDVSSFIKRDNWDYVFIYKKNDRFTTHANDKYKNEQSLSYELKCLVRRSGIKNEQINQIAYIAKKKILKDIKERTNSQIFKNLEEALSIKLTRQDMGKLSGILTSNRDINVNEYILVDTIDSVKGLEGEKCLFLLTTDLVPYLILENLEQNKMLNYLYVALTRAKDELTILITTEVEKKYGKEVLHQKLDFIKNII